MRLNQNGYGSIHSSWRSPKVFFQGEPENPRMQDIQPKQVQTGKLPKSKTGQEGGLGQWAILVLGATEFYK